MTRKVDTYEYESLGECIRSDQVPAKKSQKYLQIKNFINGIRRSIGT